MTANKKRDDVTTAQDEKFAALAAKITLWVENKRLDDALSQSELCALEGGQRLLALGKSLLVNQIKLCRAQPRAGTAGAVLTLITFLSDWGKTNCACTLATTRMAELLSRSERAIRDAIDSLENDGLIFVNRTANGLPNSYFPAVPSVIPTMNPSNVSFINALSTERKPGRPRLVASATEKNPRKQSSGDYEKHPEAERKNPGSWGAQHTSLHFSWIERPEWAGLSDDFLSVCNSWGSENEGPAVTPMAADEASSRLVGYVEAARNRFDNPSDLVTLSGVRSAIEKMRTAAAKGKGPKAAAKYFERVIIDAMGQAVRDVVAHQAKAETDREIHNTMAERRKEGAKKPRPRARADQSGADNAEYIAELEKAFRVLSDAPPETVWKPESTWKPSRYPSGDGGPHKKSKPSPYAGLKKEQIERIMMAREEAIREGRIPESPIDIMYRLAREDEEHRAEVQREIDAMRKI